MKRKLSLVLVLLIAVAAMAQTSSQRVVFTTLNPPTACAPGKLYTNKTTGKVYLGSSVGGCTDVTGGTVVYGDTSVITFGTRSKISSPSNGSLLLTTNDGTTIATRLKLTDHGGGSGLDFYDGSGTNLTYTYSGGFYIYGGGSPSFLAGVGVSDQAHFRLSGVTNPIDLAWTSGDASGTVDTALFRHAAGVVEVNNGTAGTLRDITFRNFKGSGTGAAQFRTTQTTAPTCTTNCGTTPTVTGTDTFMKIVLGTTPASGFLVTFNGTWAAAPPCIVQMGLAGMVVGKMALTAATTTTTITIVTNGTAPSTGDVYFVHCGGLS